jgi:hypothetical protein
MNRRPPEEECTIRTNPPSLADTKSAKNRAANGANGAAPLPEDVSISADDNDKCGKCKLKASASANGSGKQDLAAAAAAGGGGAAALPSVTSNGARQCKKFYPFHEAFYSAPYMH